MVRPLPIGCRLTALYDCCHSGSALDLPYEYVSYQWVKLIQGIDGYLKKPNILREAAHGLLDVQTSYAKGDIQGLLTAGITLVKDITTTPEKLQTFRRTMTSPADVIQFSGCKDYQTSADAMEGVTIVQISLNKGTTYRSNELGISAGPSTSTAAELQVSTP